MLEKGAARVDFFPNEPPARPYVMKERAGKRAETPWVDKSLRLRLTLGVPRCGLNEEVPGWPSNFDVQNAASV